MEAFRGQGDEDVGNSSGHSFAPSPQALALRVQKTIRYSKCPPKPWVPRLQPPKDGHELRLLGVLGRFGHVGYVAPVEGELKAPGGGCDTCDSM